MGVGASHRYRPALPSHGSQAAATCRLQPGGLTLRGVGMLPCPVGGWGQRELSPLGETGAGCSLSRGCLTAPETWALTFPQVPTQRRLLGTPCTASGRGSEGGCACVLPQAGLLGCALWRAGLPGFDGCRRAPWPRIDANTCPHLRHCVRTVQWELWPRDMLCESWGHV